MTVQKSQYEASLAEYSNHQAAIALLKQHRPYLEMIPSLRRPDESVISIPLPIVRLCKTATTASQAISLPCDVGILMCDPEWKIKTGVEILIFIHRPDEDFSDLLGRWRQSQVVLDNDYEWLMPLRHSHILSEGSDSIYPLFVIFSETSERIQRGLVGAELPFIMQTSNFFFEENCTDAFSPEIPPA
ncbi:hypothetical protein VF14_15005 [Nostoc linckia z18]|jgi:hypothetical protein|uniref:Type IV pilin PilA n=2 Tax=Nostoc linckia TaxID=92942 RepID=A0A9Q5ZDJ2_NOSLI|nr:hypothetical protein [Nostoc linckia]PHK39665.1 hypothetical protein VF12_13525 [Nostoc linckia z15]PHK45526.1 hypothetical protein VF13_15735 [Nostoc linckia z16]PHJ66060.1 hypothetical protein VF02_09505 [Nostoc linckia z1]PHJ68967.1 hypothetical protein VF05_15140 [Nostoc linckia z3]PHJ74618.1 hypothetical protein VF03_13965 [Nostoc linckia z2]